MAPKVAKIVTKDETKARGKARAKGKAASKLSQSTLAAMDSDGMSVQEKVKMALDQGEGVQTAVANLTSSLNKNDKAKVWSKVNIACRDNPEMKAEHDALPKGRKMDWALTWYVDSEASRCSSLTASVASSRTQTKTETWVSHKMAFDMYGDDLEWHIQSGRILRRECALTPGCFEFMDTQDIKTIKTIQKAKTLTYGQETALEGEDPFDQIFAGIYDAELGGASGWLVEFSSRSKS